MNLVTLDNLRAHVKSDGDDDDLLSIYGNAAEEACARACNRHFYKDQPALDAARAGLPTLMEVAYTAYDAAIEAAALIEDERLAADAEEAAEIDLAAARSNQLRTRHGKVAGPDVLAAVLLTAGHLYVNRQDGVPGDLQPPAAAAALLYGHMWVPPL